MPSIFLKGHQAMAGKEPGQAALLAVILLPVLLLAALFVFNTGQLTATKLRTQNAADGAAYSAMQLQARQLNFIAYTNRAMVANQVAMGQMVSLVSWSRYAKTLGKNIDHLGTLASWIPGVGQIIKSITQTIQQISSALETGVSAMS
ncbi:MAG: pilus assembly protein TadG-related protein, partial [Sulfuriferula sp.]